MFSKAVRILVPTLVFLLAGCGKISVKAAQQPDTFDTPAAAPVPESADGAPAIRKAALTGTSVVGRWRRYVIDNYCTCSSILCCTQVPRDTGEEIGFYSTGQMYVLAGGVQYNNTYTIETFPNNSQPASKLTMRAYVMPDGTPWVSVAVQNTTTIKLYDYPSPSYLRGQLVQLSTSPETAPAAPTGLVGMVASATQVNLSWVDRSGNETGFTIERKTGTAGIYAAIGTVGANVTTFTSTGLAAGVTYYFRVAAVNAGGPSAYSNEAIVTIAVPTAPTGAAATVAGPTQVNVAWTAGTNNATGYAIERKTGATGVYSQIGAVPGNVLAFGDTTVAANTTYVYRVRAYNGMGYSPYSNETTILAGPPAAPSSLSASAVATSLINLLWLDNSKNESGYVVERKTGATGTYAPVATLKAGSRSTQISGLVAGTTYYFRVRAYNAAGYSGYSNEAYATTYP